MAVSIDRWSPGGKVRRVRRAGTPPRASTRRGVRIAIAGTPLPAPRSQPEFASIDRQPQHPLAIRALTCWLGFGTILLMTCPPLWSVQTVAGALPLWLAGLPAASLACVAIARRSKPALERQRLA